MRIKLLIILTVLVGGCGTTSKIKTVSEGNKDVFILSILIQDYLRKTDGRDFSINDLNKCDTLRTISNNFNKIDFKTCGGYLSVHYKFSDSRDNKIVLNDKEKEKINHLRWTVKKINDQYDGEIRFGFGERRYLIEKIIIKK